MVEEFVPKMTKSETKCYCGGNALHQVGTVHLKIQTKRVAVLNVPHYHCVRCGRNTIDSRINLMPTLKFAYEQGLDIVDFGRSDADQQQ